MLSVLPRVRLTSPRSARLPEAKYIMYCLNTTMKFIAYFNTNNSLSLLIRQNINHRAAQDSDRNTATTAYYDNDIIISSSIIIIVIIMVASLPHRLREGELLVRLQCATICGSAL